ncbi:Dorsalin-1 [Acipenser ruthenus]|uniref:Dorsalin-1 n=1 Tax=Acipenser ruthenus TaxID=7906 RepID=A0A662Z0C1_ACIRT|nr:Dorsalin-1 [Acipenser ruthenus]
MAATLNYILPLWMIVLVFVGSARCKPVNSKTSGVQKQLQISEDESTVEEDIHIDLNPFLENMKQEFLRSLNLSRVPHEHNKADPPQFMLELYNRYTTDKSSMPQSNIARSFNVKDATMSKGTASEKQHLLLFNISIPSHEEITMAELRLYTFLENDTNDVQARIKVYDVENNKDGSTLHFLASKDVNKKQNSWETFEVTKAIKRWVKSSQTTNTLQVQIDRTGGMPLEGGGLDVSVSFKNSSPVLIIFSDDLRNEKKEDELKEMILHEEESVFLAEGNMNYDEDKPPSRRKRSTKPDFCQRRSLRVDFKEIGWDWIVAPKEYEAYECKGVCSYPLGDNLTPSKHALVQTLVHFKNPKKTAKPCCVPTKLDSISILYYDEKGQPTFQYKYEGMQVAKCGCR